MSESQRMEIRISPTMLERLDEKRGDVPRGRYIKNLIAKDLGTPPMMVSEPAERALRMVKPQVQFE